MTPRHPASTLVFARFAVLALMFGACDSDDAATKTEGELCDGKCDDVDAGPAVCTQEDPRAVACCWERAGTLECAMAPRAVGSATVRVTLLGGASSHPVELADGVTSVGDIVSDPVVLFTDVQPNADFNVRLEDVSHASLELALDDLDVASPVVLPSAFELWSLELYNLVGDWGIVTADQASGHAELRLGERLETTFAVPRGTTELDVQLRTFSEHGISTADVEGRISGSGTWAFERDGLRPYEVPELSEGALVSACSVDATRLRCSPADSSLSDAVVFGGGWELRGASGLVVVPVLPQVAGADFEAELGDDYPYTLRLNTVPADDIELGSIEDRLFELSADIYPETTELELRYPFDVWSAELFVDESGFGAEDVFMAVVELDPWQVELGRAGAQVATRIDLGGLDLVAASPPEPSSHALRIAVPPGHERLAGNVSGATWSNDGFEYRMFVTDGRWRITTTSLERE